MEVKIVCYENEKTKGTYLGFEIDLGYRVCKIFPKEQITFCEILNILPADLHALPVGVVKTFKEVK